jgi:hypothetical protein
MSNQILQKFKLDLGTAFPVLVSYLSTTDKLSLSATCIMFRKLIFRPNIWQTLVISNHLLKKLSESS